MIYSIISFITLHVSLRLRFFSEDKYYAKDFLRPTPNIDEPKREPGMELALIGVQSTVEPFNSLTLS